jgi:hypothetical protein
MDCHWRVCGFVIAGVVMHRVFVNILKNESPESEKKVQS